MTEYVLDLYVLRSFDKEADIRFQNWKIIN